MKLEKHVQNFRPVANHVMNIQYDKQKKVIQEQLLYIWFLQNYLSIMVS